MTSSTTPVSVTVTNTIQQLTGSFNVTKTVTGAGKAGGYTPGAEFDFEVTCATPPGTPVPFSLADGESVSPGTPVPVGTSCTVTELASRPTTPPAFGWDPVAVLGQRAVGGNWATRGRS